MTLYTEHLSWCAEMSEVEFISTIVREADGLLIDTHGAAVIDPVWLLLEAAYRRIGGSVPTCLERDFNMPDLPALTAEVEQIARLQAALPASRRVA